MFVNRLRYGLSHTIGGMAPNVHEILWENVAAIMRHHYKEENLQRLARDTKIGPGSASRIKAKQTSVGINVLAKIAKYFDLQAWHLLLPNLDPGNAPVAFLSETERNLYVKLKKAHAIVTS